MKKYKVEVIKNPFSEKIKEKDIDTHLANSLELYLNKNHKSGWDLISLENLTFEVKTSFLRKRQKVKKNIAIFSKTEDSPSEENKNKKIEPNIPLGPAIKKM
tara:strand:+ start:35 stop:340 length:306 start_codon:yes stop_codon:yes gene_type:complete